MKNFQFIPTSKSIILADVAKAVATFSQEEILNAIVFATAMELFAKTLKDSLKEDAICLIELEQKSDIQGAKLTLRETKEYDFSQDDVLKDYEKMLAEIKAHIKAREIILKATAQPKSTTKSIAVTLPD
jgi:hypothetical protein